MLFNSVAFLGAFLPVVVAGYWILRSRAGMQASQGFLLLASLFFYAYAKPSYLPMLLGSILFNWAVGVWMGKYDLYTDKGEAQRNRILWFGIAANVAFLSTFKYVNFFFRHLSFFGAHGLLLPNWVAPLGISFFTFTQLMYLVDTCQGLNKPNSLFDHATLVSMFPYIAAGPLVRSSSIVPQFRKDNTNAASWDLGCRGLFLFTMGLAKKVILADAFAHIADIGFNKPDEYSTLEAWIFAVFYAFQIYYDFSGYSDMAVGCAWMLGYDIPQNFNKPYIAKSMSEFWTRWHISLSNFITNYLYTPILRGLGKATLTTSVFAVIAAMFIAGLWHGAAWTFIIWGTLHGVALGVNQIWKRKKLWMPEWLGWLLTFLFVVITLVFFRSTSVPAALHMLYDMLPRRNLLDDYAIKYVMPVSALVKVRLVTVGIFIAFFFSTAQQMAEKLRMTRWTALATATLMLWSLLFLNSAAAKEFIYFAF
jgi:alginate O-acetyltransferase complex protein AlgI